METDLREMMFQTAEKHLGKRKITNKTKPWLTPEIKAEIKKRNELRKTISINRKEWTGACRRVAELVKEEKQKRWKEYVEQLDMKTNPKQVWQTIRGMDGRHPDTAKNEDLAIDGVALIEDKDKAEAFAKTYRILQTKSQKIG